MLLEFNLLLFSVSCFFILINFIKITTFPSLPGTVDEAEKEYQLAISQQPLPQPPPVKAVSIEEKIEIFLNPEKTLSHGRGIMYDEAEKIGLKVNLIKKREARWKLLLKIYYRTDFLTSSMNRNIIKVIESPSDSYSLMAQS